LRKWKVAWKYKQVSTIGITRGNIHLFQFDLPYQYNTYISNAHIYVKSFDTSSRTSMSDSNVKNISRQRGLLFIYNYSKHSHARIMKQDKLNRPERYKSYRNIFYRMILIRRSAVENLYYKRCGWHFWVCRSFYLSSIFIYYL
jgi:hypothetical protein